MLGYIYRIVISFEREHGMRPNLLLINPEHLQYLKASFDERYTMGDIMDLLKMEVVIDSASVHPHVCWTQTLRRAAS